MSKRTTAPTLYLLTIDSRQYLLTSMSGVQTVINTLSRARMFDGYFSTYGDHDHLPLKPDSPEISIQVLTGYTITSRRQSDVIEPEVLPPEWGMSAREMSDRLTSSLGRRKTARKSLPAPRLPALNWHGDDEEATL